MSGIREYLLSVTASAIVCGIINSICAKKGSAAKLVKLLAGIFMTFSVLQPVLNLPINSRDVLYDVSEVQVDDMVTFGQESAQAAQKEIIKNQAEAYIMDKAEQLNCNLEISVILQKQSPFAPDRVRIKGKFSPYVRSQLSSWIESNIGISEEDQSWTG